MRRKPFYPEDERKQGRCGGFTLIEVLVGVFVFSIVALGLPSLLYNSIRFRRDVFSKNEDKREAARMLFYLRDDLIHLTECPDGEIGADRMDPGKDLLSFCRWEEQKKIFVRFREFRDEPGNKDHFVIRRERARWQEHSDLRFERHQDFSLGHLRITQIRFAYSDGPGAVKWIFRSDLSGPLPRAVRIQFADARRPRLLWTRSVFGKGGIFDVSPGG